MRKKLFNSLIVAITVFTALTITACGKGNLDKYSKNIAELRERLYAAEDADYKVRAISGVREDPYEIDGVVAGKREFTVITVTPSDYRPDVNYRYRVTVGDKTYEGDMLPHPFAQSISADIAAAAKAGFTFTLIGDGERSYEMKDSVSGGVISAEKAFSIALNKLKPQLRRFRERGKLNAEIYVRLVENPIDGSGGYYWYVSFVGSGRDTVAVLLRGETGEVGAIRK